jgi:hypothetical protein
MTRPTPNRGVRRHQLGVPPFAETGTMPSNDARNLPPPQRRASTRGGGLFAMETAHQ